MSVYFYGCITLDGYLADKNHSLGWLHESGSTEETGYSDFYSKMNVTIMGKRTFDEIAAMDNISSFYPTTKNYVFTHNEKFSANGFMTVNKDIVDFVKTIPSDKSTWIIGGNTLLTPLLNADMVDKMIIQIAPVLLGAGVPLFTQKEEQKRFYLEKVNQFGQFAELVYKKQ